MKDKISFVSEQANSPFLIGQLVNEIFAYYHFLELVVIQCVGLIMWPTGEDREHTAIPNSPSEPFNPLPSCISTTYVICIMLNILSIVDEK